MEPNDTELTVVAHNYSLEWIDNIYWFIERAVYNDGSHQLVARYHASSEQIMGIKGVAGVIKDYTYYKPSESYYDISYKCSVDNYQMTFYHSVTASNVGNAIDIFHIETSLYCNRKHKVMEVKDISGNILLFGITSRNEVP